MKKTLTATLLIAILLMVASISQAQFSKSEQLSSTGDTCTYEIGKGSLIDSNWIHSLSFNLLDDSSRRIPLDTASFNLTVLSFPNTGITIDSFNYSAGWIKYQIPSNVDSLIIIIRRVNTTAYGRCTYYINYAPDNNLLTIDPQWKDTTKTKNSVTVTQNRQVVNFEIFPNPVANTLNITDANHTQHMIYDLSGNLVILTYDNTIDISKLSNGTYYLRVADNTKSFLVRH